MEYSIEGGTHRLSKNAEGIDTYVYRFTDRRGEHTIVFLAALVPKIGDKIVNGLHIPLLDWKINPDASKWIEYYADRATDGDINPNDGPFSGATAPVSALPSPPLVIKPPSVVVPPPVVAPAPTEPYSVNEIFAVGTDGTATDSAGLVARIDTFANTDTNALDY